MRGSTEPPAAAGQSAATTDSAAAGVAAATAWNTGTSTTPAAHAPSAPEPSPQTPPVDVTVRYFAGARAAAGTVEETVQVRAGTPLRAVLEHIRAGHGERLSTVLASCSFLLDGVAVHQPETPVHESVQLDVLPPFAGG